MSATATTPIRDPELVQVAAVLDLLGLKTTRAAAPKTPIEVHEFVSRGLPASALKRLVDHVPLLQDRRSFEDTMAMSLRSYQRLQHTPTKTLGPDVSGRLWRFAEIRALAGDVLGGSEAADRWLVSPAIGLSGRRPIDLMGTPPGARLVETLLRRMDYGVYA